jgi:transketolase C-terminal domain/subunit
MEFRKVLYNELSALMKENNKIVVLDADLGKPNGIYPLSQEYPDR